MKNKGFTMIEILAVFTLTAVILLITVPLVTGNLKKGNMTVYKEFKDTVFIATEAYVNNESSDLIKENSCWENASLVSIKELIKLGYLKSTMINPYNNKKISDSENEKINIKICKNNENILEFEIEGLEK